MGMFDSIKSSASGGKQGGKGGQLQKAKIVVTEDWSGNFKDIEFLYNPETVSITKQAEFKEHQTQGADTGKKEWTHGISRALTISDLYFDTYETRKNVREQYVNKLERLVHRDSTLKRPPKVLFVWGSFMKESDDYNSNQWYVTSVTVNYTMFLNDGTPVRAKISLQLKETNSQEGEGSQSQSGKNDQHSVHTLKQGETLQNVSAKKYGDSGKWRPIADANNIDDPMNVPPGKVLKIPPK